MNNIISLYYLSLCLSCVLAILPVGIQAETPLDLRLPDYNLPDIGDASIDAFSYAKEHEIGLDILRSLRAKGATLEDPEISAWIRSLGNRLSARAPNAHNPFYFLVIKDNRVNAFATLGGVVVVNSGLILQSESEDELAAVISHEIAHITQRHIARAIENSKHNMLGTGATILAGVLASSKNPTVGQALITGAVAMQAHRGLSFSRAAESEADRVGLRILAAAGFNPAAMPLFLKKLDAEFSSTKGVNNEYLRSHPLTVKRISDTRSAAAQYHHLKPRYHDTTYQYLREKIRVLSRAKGKNGQLPAHLPARIKRYAKAAQLLQRGNTSAVLKILSHHMVQKSERLLKADALLLQKNYAAVIRLLKPLLRLYPGENSIVIPLSNAYLGLGKVQQAGQIIRHVVVSEQSSLIYFETRQRIAQQAGLQGSAYYAVAEKNLRIGAYKHVITQARQAMKSATISPAELQSLQRLLATALKAEKTRNK